MQTTRLILAATAAALLSTTAVSFAKSPADVLVVAKGIDDIVSLDPAQAYEFTSNEVVANVYDRLIEYDPANTEKLNPSLAESWTASADGKTITFKLRAGAKFASGNPVRPEDVVFSLARVVKLNKAPAFILTQMGWTPANVGEMVKKVSDSEVAVTVAEKLAPSFALNLLASDTGSIVDEKIVAANVKDNDFGNGWLSHNSAGSGAFALKLWQANEAVVLDANPSHPGGAPKIKQVVLNHVGEPSTQRLMLESGDADIAYNLAPDQVAALKANPDVRVETYPQADLHFLSFNIKQEKLRNPALWEAMKYLIDYDGIANTLLHGQMKVHQSFWPSGFPGAVDDTPYKLDVAKAKDILAKGKVPDGLTIEVDMIASSPFTEIGQSMQATFAQAGIKLSLLPGTGAQVITKYRARTHEAMLLYWGPDFMDPHSNAGAFAYNVDNSDGAPQSTTAWRNAWSDPALSAKTKAALVELDPAKRLDMYRDLQRDVMKAAPWAMTFQTQKQVALRQNVKGYINGPVPNLVLYSAVTKN